MHRLATVILIFTSLSLSGQSLNPLGKFLTDSVKIGEQVKFSLSVEHAAHMQVLFPDSGFSYAPFELIDKEFFPTRTNGAQSFDSAVYLLRTFSLETEQALSLPVFYTSEGDSLSYSSTPDTVFLKEYIAELPLDIELKEQTEYNAVAKKFNYPYIIAYILIGGVSGWVLYTFFGKSIRRRYKLFIVRTDHMGFIKNFQKLYDDFARTKKPMAIEQALSSWKAYLARLENKPINTYTTTEIINLYNKEELRNGLNVIDRAIYGGLVSDEAEKALITLKRFSNRQYHRRKKEIQNG